MAHYEQVEYCLNVKNKFPSYFKNCKVADFGSLDINGCNRFLFEDCLYLGIDIGPGNNVNCVSKAHEFYAPKGFFDTIISTEMFEHDKYLNLSLLNIVNILKSTGLFLFTCATIGREEHGTRRSLPCDSPLTCLDTEWEDFYENVDENKIRSILDIDSIFSEYEFNVINSDLRFYGIKK